MERSPRERVTSAGRDTPVRQWEVFVREAATEPVHHVGSVAGASAADAHQHAAKLFDRFAVDIWLCPADAVERYATRPLETDGRDETAGSDATVTEP